jgi:hypothetical protein
MQRTAVSSIRCRTAGRDDGIRICAPVNKRATMVARGADVLAFLGQKKRAG